MKKFLRTIIAVTLAATMLLGMGVCAFAEADAKPIYTCLGDSNSAAHGLDGWHENRVPVPGAYHSIIAEELGYELKPFGSGGYRTSEIRYLIDPTYEMDWEYAKICNSNVTKEFMDTYKDAYFQAVVDADLITIQVGANDIMGDALGFAFLGYDDPIQFFEDLKAKIPAESSIFSVIETLDSLVKALKLVTNLYNNIQAKYPVFREDWDAIIKRIYEVNPDVEIVVLSAVNSFGNVSFTGSPVKGGRIFDLPIAKLNNWIAYGSEWADTYKFVDVTDFRYTSLSMADPDFWATYLPLVHPNGEQHRAIADRVIDVIENDKQTTATPIEVAFGKALTKILWK